MSAIDAITKSNAGAGQAAGKAGALASGSFDQLFTISTELPVDGDGALPGDDETLAEETRFGEEHIGALGADLDVILGFAPVALPHVTAPRETEATRLPGIPDGTVLAVPEGSVLPMPLFSLGADLVELPPMITAVPWPERAESPLSENPTPGQIAVDAPRAIGVQGPVAEGALMDPVILPPLPSDGGLGPKVQAMHAVTPAAVPAVEVAAADPGLPPKAATPLPDTPAQKDVRPAAFGDEDADTAVIRKADNAPLTRSALPIQPTQDAPPDEVLEGQGQIVARLRIQLPDAAAVSAMAVRAAGATPVDAVPRSKGDTDLPMATSEQAGGGAPMPKFQAAPGVIQAARGAAPTDAGSAAPMVPISSAPTAELLRATLDTRDAVWRERMVTQFLGDGRPGAHSLTLSLRPKSLGDIQLSVDVGAGETTVRIVAETPAAVRLIMANEDVLSNLMEQAGVRLAGLSVQHMAASGWMVQTAGHVAVQNSAGPTAREGNSLRKDRARGVEVMRAAPDTSLKLGDGSQLGINLMA